jgi:hypothetical protein
MSALGGKADIGTTYFHVRFWPKADISPFAGTAPVTGVWTASDPDNAPGRSAMTQAIGALCVAALGGLTIIAYRHPKEYQKLYLVLIIIILMSMWTMVAFNIGIHWSQSAIWDSNVYEYENASKATYAISNAIIPDWIMGVLPTALIAYIVFLSTFQYLLTNDKQ